MGLLNICNCFENSNEDSTICPCKRKRKGTKEEAIDTLSEKRFSADPRQESFCNAAFLPEFVRTFIAKRGEIPEDEERKAMVKNTSGIVLTFEIPGLADLVYYYSVSIDYSSEDISSLLNLHVSNLIKGVMGAGGDVIVLEAGYIQCLWLVRLDQMNDLAPHVLNTALHLQKTYGNTETRFGISLRNRIGISCGKIKGFFVGMRMVHFVLIGDAVSDSFHAVSECANGEVVVSREFWKAVIQKDEYKYQTLPNEYVTIFSLVEPTDNNEPADSGTGVIRSTSSTQTGVERKTSSAQTAAERKQSSNSETAAEGELSSSAQELTGSSSHQVLKMFEQKYGDEMSNYLHPLHQSAKTTQQIQFLCSVCNVACVTISVKNLNLSTPDQLHDMIEYISDMAQRHRGVMKTIIYNKNIIVGVYFGYPGLKHSNDIVRSIEFSQDVFKILTQNNLQANIGISTGLIFCGLIGPPARKQYCLIGIPVRISYQLSKAYEESVILCGLNTYFLTRRFVGDIFDPVNERIKVEIDSHMDPEMLFEIAPDPKRSVPSVKCVGRIDEKEDIAKTLMDLRDKLVELEDQIVPLFLIVGKMGMGKTTLFKCIMEKADKMGFHLSSQVENLSFEETFENAWQIVIDILQKSGNDSDDKILNLVEKKESEFPLHKLNDRLNTEFKHVMASYGEEDLRKLFITLIIKASKGRPVLIGIDNLEHVGTETWLFLQELLLIRAAVVVATVTEEYTPSLPFVKSLMTQQFNSLIMRPLDEEELGLLACCVLNVKAINREFLPYFLRFSEGNALRMEEILMIPPIQKHFVILPASSVKKKKLDSEFLFNKDVSSRLVCDAIDAQEMDELEIPDHLLDVVRDHTTGLNPEEQMLIRKCALLGNKFGFFVLEAVCPEYPPSELRYKLRNLLKKNLLRLECQHLELTEKDNQETIALREIPVEFCVHPISFYCDYLKTSVLNVMPESQRQRLSLYLADLLMTTPRCDSCRNEWSIRRHSSLSSISRHFHLPCVDMRMCQCLEIKTHFALQVEYHLEKGNGSVRDRIDMLIEAAEFGVITNSPNVVDKIIFKAKKLLIEIGQSNEMEIDPSTVAIARLKAQVLLLYGKNNEAMREIKKALLLVNVLFPSDIERNITRQKWTKSPLATEFMKCLHVGCVILKVLGLNDIAYKGGKYHAKILAKCGHSFVDTARSKRLLLTSVWKTKPSRKRERQSTKLGNQIRRLCFKRLTQYPVLDLVELKAAISAFKAVLNMLFEKGELEAAEELGKKVFQLLVLVKDEKQLTRVLSILARVYFFQHNDRKCLEMINQLEDAYQQCPDPVADVIYFSSVVLALRFTNFRDIYKDKIEICNEYAARTPALPTHPKFKDRVLCLCAHMCMWSGEQGLLDASGIWANRASNLLQTARMDNFWTLMGSICLITADTERIERNFVIYTTQELQQIKRNLIKDMEALKKAVSNYVPVLNSMVEEIEKNFVVAIERCKILK